MSKYPEITPDLVAKSDADQPVLYDAARGNEDAQLWLAHFYLAQADTLGIDGIGGASARLNSACTFAGLAASHGRVDAIRIYSECLKLRQGPDAIATQNLIAKLDAAIEGRKDTKRVKVKI